MPVRINPNSRDKRFPIWGWIGLCVVAIFWLINWFFPGKRTMWAFFPLWTGFSLVVDGLVYYNKSGSQLSRNWKGFLALFALSAPCWWLFELLNLRVRNWQYTGVEELSPICYFVFATVSFSTVMPAVFSTAELVSSFQWIKRIPLGFRIPNSRRTAYGFLFSGLASFIFLLVWPDYFFPFLWLSIYFILEALNSLIGIPGLYQFTDIMDWRPIISLFMGVLICGFFWEFWNFYSYPKWTYTIPFFNQIKFFEMPLAGYLGYLPFSLELNAIFELANRYLKMKDTGLIKAMESSYKKDQEVNA